MNAREGMLVLYGSKFAPTVQRLFSELFAIPWMELKGPPEVELGLVTTCQAKSAWAVEGDMRGKARSIAMIRRKAEK